MIYIYKPARRYGSLSRPTRVISLVDDFGHARSRVKNGFACASIYRTNCFAFGGSFMRGKLIVGFALLTALSFAPSGWAKSFTNKNLKGTYTEKFSGFG